MEAWWDDQYTTRVIKVGEKQKYKHFKILKIKIKKVGKLELKC